MKICITSKGKGLNAMIDPRFGRCQNFIVVDVESMEFEDHENPYIDSTGGGVHLSDYSGGSVSLGGRDGDTEIYAWADVTPVTARFAAHYITASYPI